MRNISLCGVAMERGSAMEQGPERVPLRNAGSSCPLLGRALSLGTALPWGDGEHSSALLGCAGPGSAPWLGEAVSPDSQTGRRSGVLLPQKHRKSPHITSDLPRRVMFPGSPGCCPRMSTSLSAHFCQHTACWHSHRGLSHEPGPNPTNTACAVRAPQVSMSPALLQGPRSPAPQSEEGPAAPGTFFIFNRQHLSDGASRVSNYKEAFDIGKVNVGEKSVPFTKLPLLKARG